MPDRLPVIELGNPILRQTAQVLQKAEGADSDLQAWSDSAPCNVVVRLETLIDNLIHTVQAASGVGIAAPQVAESQRLFIMASHPNPRYPNAPEMEPIAIINPRIIAHSDETEKDWEGCLSVPGIRGLVPRWKEIEVEYYGRDGQLQHRVLTNFLARIFQHELDHLDGVVFLDRVETTQDLMTEQEYQTRIVGAASAKA
jgi:peptide deformylase